jgi:hypothetical protein
VGDPVEFAAVANAGGFDGVTGGKQAEGLACGEDVDPAEIVVERGKGKP